MKMKTKIRIFPLAIMGVFLILASSCYKPVNMNLNSNPGINPTPTPDRVTDIDGNVYHTVTIGSQVWMKENLRVTHYSNGDLIWNVTQSSKWIILKTSAYCNYANNPNIYFSYGRLYNWYAVHDPRNIAPNGWHVATDDEWTTLSNYLGGNDTAGGQLKEAGDAYWPSPNTGATNSSGFTALPTGYRTNDGSYTAWGYVTFWWTSTPTNDSLSGWYRNVGYNYDSIGHGTIEKYYGFSIRCVMDGK